MANEEDRFQLAFYDWHLSECEPVEMKHADTFKEALDLAIENMAVDQASDRVTIWDNQKERFRANLLWDKDTGEVLACAQNDDKRILAVGEEEALNYFLRKHK